MHERDTGVRDESGRLVAATSFVAVVVVAALIALFVWEPWNAGTPAASLIRFEPEHKGETMSNNDTPSAVQTVREDTKDTLDELKNRAQATGEKLSRDVQGDNMSLGDRIKSNVSEAGHNLKAEFDKAKRDVRHDAGDDTTPDAV
jgi:hypothetical protein